SFDHDDGVIHHQADRQDQAEERKGVDGKTQERKNSKRPDERDGNRQHGYERSAPALEKDEDNEHDQGKRYEQSLEDFANAFGHRVRGIEREDKVQIRWKALLQFRHSPFDALFGFESV